MSDSLPGMGTHGSGDRQVQNSQANSLETRVRNSGPHTVISVGAGPYPGLVPRWAGLLPTQPQNSAEK